MKSLRTHGLLLLGLTAVSGCAWGESFIWTPPGSGNFSISALSGGNWTQSVPFAAATGTGAPQSCTGCTLTFTVGVTQTPNLGGDPNLTGLQFGSGTFSITGTVGIFSGTLVSGNLSAQSGSDTYVNVNGVPISETLAFSETATTTGFLSNAFLTSFGLSPQTLSGAFSFLWQPVNGSNGDTAFSGNGQYSQISTLNLSNPIPEPGSILLLGAGIAALGAFRKFNRRRTAA